SYGMMISLNVLKSVDPIWSDVIMQKFLSWASSSVTSAPRGFWSEGIVNRYQGTTSWMSKTVSPPTQANCPLAWTWIAASALLGAPIVLSTPPPGRFGTPKERGFESVGERSEQPARIPMLTSVSSPARRRDMMPSAVVGAFAGRACRPGWRTSVITGRRSTALEEQPPATHIVGQALCREGAVAVR